MKRITLVLGCLAFASIMFTSCKKDWTCACTTAGVKVNFTIAVTTKSIAKDDCNARNVGTTTTCELY